MTGARYLALWYAKALALAAVFFAAGWFAGWFTERMS